MMSGAGLTEHWVTLSRRPDALQLLVTLVMAVGGTTVPELADETATAPATPLPFEANAVCDDSTDTANQAILPQSSTNRMAGWRAQLKPATYCASMVSGTFSVLFRMPTRFCVAKLHI